MDKSGLLTIREFSDLTKVNPKSLRYYDSLGILKPAYIDPDNGYRYYSVFQREMVYAINMCIEAGIPLKRLAEEGYASDSHIDFQRLMAQCVAVFEERIRRYQEIIDMENGTLGSVRRADLISRSPVPVTFAMDEMYCLVQPYDGFQHTPAWQQQVKELISRINRQDMGQVLHTGLLLKREENEWRQYLFVSVRGDDSSLAQYPDLIRIPSGVYLRKKVERSGMDQVFGWTAPYTPPENIELVVETELLMGDYRIDPPPLEQRCLIRQTPQ